MQSHSCPATRTRVRRTFFYPGTLGSPFFLSILVCVIKADRGVFLSNNMMMILMMISSEEKERENDCQHT